jgi:DNA-binding response OmpR family regulator
LARARILIVEDEPNIAEALNFLFQRADFDVEIVKDGAEALKGLRTLSYSAVILDIMLPGISGFEVLKAIRADPLLKALPVIVLTAKGQANDRKTAEAIGATAFITKPFSNAEVVARVCELTKP